MSISFTGLDINFNIQHCKFQLCEMEKSNYEKREEAQGGNKLNYLRGTVSIHPVREVENFYALKLFESDCEEGD